MARLLSSLLIALLGLLPSRTAVPGATPRRRRPGRRPSHARDGDELVPVEARDRARTRTTALHRWRGEIVIDTGTRRIVTDGEWQLTLAPSERPKTVAISRAPLLDPTRPDLFHAELAALLALRHPGSRLAVTHADGSGWQQLEVRLPSHPETIVQLDRAAVAGILDGTPESVRVTLHVFPERAPADTATTPTR